KHRNVTHKHLGQKVWKCHTYALWRERMEMSHQSIQAIKHALSHICTHARKHGNVTHKHPGEKTRACHTYAPRPETI
ncbi:hypothetical protein NDU88_011693, partial [Pleurodeles waltl]